MLLELSVFRIALIESLHLELGSGLCVFTGETGAGKSILLDAIGLLIGNRASSDLIRMGADDAIVEGTFSVDENAGEEVARLLQSWDIEDNEGLVVLSRRLYRNGRTICRINGQMGTVQMLRDLGGYLIQQHGQHEHQSLLHPDEQLRLLDAYSQNGELLEQLRAQYHLWKTLREAFVQAQLNEEERARRMDMLQYQIAEIEKAQLSPGEEDELRQERAKLSHMEKIAEAVETALERLNGNGKGGAVEDVTDALHAVRTVLEYDPRLRAASEYLETAQVHLDEANRELSAMTADLEANPQRLEEIEDRIALLRLLQRRYGATVEDVLNYYRTIVAEYKQYENYDESLEKMRRDLDAAEATLLDLSRRLHEDRDTAAGKFADALGEILRELHMPNASFEIALQTKEKNGKLEYGPNGADSVAFLFCSNKGSEAKPLQKVASGGELSRTMLAIKAVMAESEDVGTLIFDEVDAGVSGTAAQKVAEQLLKLSCHHQVLCVTHSPQIASAGQWHYQISKRERAQDTVTEVKPVSGPERVQELAHLLGSDLADDTAVRHAEAMLESFRPPSQIRG